MSSSTPTSQELPNTTPTSSQALVSQAVKEVESRKPRWDTMTLVQYQGRNYRAWHDSIEAAFAIRYASWMLVRREHGDENLSRIGLFVLRESMAVNLRHLIQGCQGNQSISRLLASCESSSPPEGDGQHSANAR
jgi:hypothetical protein